jgi:hypothetical protein
VGECLLIDLSARPNAGRWRSRLHARLVSG